MRALFCQYFVTKKCQTQNTALLFLEKGYWQKKRAENVDEIDPS